jgi:hypothetical protein
MGVWIKWKFFSLRLVRVQVSLTVVVFIFFVFFFPFRRVLSFMWTRVRRDNFGIVPGWCWLIELGSIETFSFRFLQVGADVALPDKNCTVPYLGHISERRLNSGGFVSVSRTLGLPIHVTLANKMSKMVLRCWGSRLVGSLTNDSKYPLAIWSGFQE